MKAKLLYLLNFLKGLVEKRLVLGMLLGWLLGSGLLKVVFKLLGKLL